jgi:choline monooxygenase
MRELPAIEIDADISRAWSIPAAFYTDPEVCARERERIFTRAWQVVGHREQLLKPGGFFTTDLLGEPLLLVRGAQGELRGFYNVCRHRAGPWQKGGIARVSLRLSRLTRLT